jgi:cytochrome c oxidase assembly protein subunit 15
VKTLEATTVPAPLAPRWLHWLAVFTACAALPLVLLGAEVTTKGAGMVDLKGFRAPWHLLAVLLRERGLGVVIEYSHRLAGMVVGVCCIVLAVGLWRAGRRPLDRCLGFAALAAVVAQGLLGIFRVDQISKGLAFVHGLFAQVVFAGLVSVAVLTSRAWAAGEVGPRRAGLRRLALLLLAVVYAQIAFGAFIRHFGATDFERRYLLIAQRLHVLTAFAVVGGVVGAFLAVRERFAPDRTLRRLTGLLAALVSAQVLLGVEAYVRRFGAGPEGVQAPGFATDLVRSLHFVVGALLFTTTVVFTLLVYRPGAAAVALPAVPPRPLEGAA